MFKESLWICGFVENSPKKVINIRQLSKGIFHKPHKPHKPYYYYYYKKPTTKIAILI
jgi:hypothetical protein